LTRRESAATVSSLRFRDILGQRRVVEYLLTALRQQRLAHAYLFLGPPGVGKETTARALAAALNCQHPQDDGEACAECPSCRRLAAGNHPDFQVIAPTSEGRQPQIRIDQIRDFRRLTAYPPVEGGWRVVLIKPAEALNQAAVNALLKTLEEPPPQHLLALTAGVEDDLPPTVVSRCHKLAFTPLPTDLIVQALLKRGLGSSPAVLLAALSGGSLGRALALDPEDLLTQRRQVLTALQELPLGNTSGVLAWAADLAKKNQEVENFLLLAQLWYHDLLLCHVGADLRLLSHQDLTAELQAQSCQTGPDFCFARLAALGAAQRQWRANLNQELTLDVLGLSLQEGEFAS